ncbi:hypothetical protein [Streptomyces griseiscabiei]|uniref:Antibiotic biosynthesis monooxygenase n=1 Tax=Streptomyces griseiscabiei TaxID=2993540 RepID=A0ABU4L6V3_9ACTN|nr:hypothetical protein [Streptomyces griseiscabiei]MBZ3906418.1 hypothetical protein [Streptomyces griseiscabiei]MDX2911413.1 hypothetical protein [Streptomyces griseiscabiei]
MTSADAAREGFRTFLVLRTDGTGVAQEAVRALVEQTSDPSRPDGFLSSRIHLGLDGDVVVHSVAWRDETSARDGYPARVEEALLDRLGRKALLRTDLVGGTPEPGVRGPSANSPPGLVCVAVRHVADRAAAEAMADLLRRSGDWKKDFPGFVSATPYIGTDGRTYVNYPQWTDRGAFDAYMSDRRNVDGQQGISALEVAPPDLFLCTLVAETVAAG